MHYLSPCLVTKCAFGFVTLIFLLGNASAEIHARSGMTNAEAKTFFNYVKAANAAGDARAMAKLVSFPLTVNGKKNIKTAAVFIARYSEIFNANVRKAVERQQFETLFSNYQGAMFGDGQVWFTALCDQRTCDTYKLRIVAVNNKRFTRQGVHLRAQMPVEARGY